MRVLNMKKRLFCIFASSLIVSMLLISCNQLVNETGKQNKNDNDLDIFVLDISQETDWNYMVIGKDGSSMVFNADESTGIPSLLYLKPEKDSDDGFTYFFKENGLPDKVIHNGHILYFGNFSGYKFDLAVIYPNNAIDYHYDIETDVNWDVFNDRSISGQGRFINFNSITKSLGFVSKAIGIGTCAAAVFFPTALTGCAAYVASEVGHVAVDKIFDGYTADLSHTIIDVIGCAGNIGNVFDLITVADSCVSALAGTASMLSHLDFDLTSQKAPELAQANGVINGGRGDVKVTLSWNNLADVDLHIVDPYNEEIYWRHTYSQSGGILDFDNRHGYGPENIYWPAGNAPNGVYKVYVNFYNSGTSGAFNSSSNYTVLINAFGNTKTYTGTVTSNGGLVLVATFNNNGIITQSQNNRQVIIDKYDSGKDGSKDY
jgi:hypothetical protein